MAGFVPSIISSLNATLAVTYGVEIDPNIVSQIPFDSPIYDYLEGAPGAPRKKLGQAAVFGLLTAASFTSSTHNNGAFAAGGCPPDITTTRSLHSLTKKSYGAMAGVKDIDIIASSMGIAPHGVSGLDDVSIKYRDDAEFLLNLLYVRTRQAVDWAAVRGNSTTDANSFDGLETMVTAANGSQVLNMAGAAFSKAYLDELIVQMMIQGIIPTAIACNPIMFSSIINAYTGGGSQVSINMNMGDTGAVGYWADSVITPAGKLPLIGDRRFTTSGAAPTFTSDIFILTREHAGEPILFFEWQVLPTAIDIGRWQNYCTSQLFAVWSHLVLVEKSNWFAQGRLQNCTVTYRPTPPTAAA